MTVAFPPVGRNKCPSQYKLARVIPTTAVDQPTILLNHISDVCVSDSESAREVGGECYE